MEELELLRNVFLCNACPDNLVSTKLKESCSTQTLKAILKGIQQDVEVVEEKEKGMLKCLGLQIFKVFQRGCRESLER